LRPNRHGEGGGGTISAVIGSALVNSAIGRVVSTRNIDERLRPAQRNRRENNAIFVKEVQNLSQNRRSSILFSLAIIFS